MKPLCCSPARLFEAAADSRRGFLSTREFAVVALLFNALGIRGLSGLFGDLGLSGLRGPGALFALLTLLKVALRASVGLFAGREGKALEERGTAGMGGALTPGIAVTPRPPGERGISRTVLTSSSSR